MDISKAAEQVNGALLYAHAKTSNNVRGFLLEMLLYIKNHPEVEEALKYGQDACDVYDGAKKAVAAGKYTGSLNALVQDYGASGGAQVLSVFVDRFGALAKHMGIELNECVLSAAQVAADVGGAGTGALSSVRGFGVLLLGVSVVATFKDSYSMGKACLPQ